jgi:tRNA threonylcarbamoyladenosine biosynthesis protein TsaB
VKLLAIETSTEAQVVGVQVDGEIIEHTSIVGRQHSQKILPTILETLDDAGIDKQALDAIVFGQGPGSFTGLRIAVGVVQGLAYGLDIPVVPVSTLACLAQGEYRRRGADQIVVALFARKTEVFFGSYKVVSGIVEKQGEEGVFEAGSVPRQSFDECVGVGDGWRFEQELAASLGLSVISVEQSVHPSAIDLLCLGEATLQQGGGISALEARPQYLRERVATVPGDSSGKG